MGNGVLRDVGSRTKLIDGFDIEGLRDTFQGCSMALRRCWLPVCNGVALLLTSSERDRKLEALNSDW